MVEEKTEANMPVPRVMEVPRSPIIVGEQRQGGQGHYRCAKKERRTEFFSGFPDSGWSGAGFRCVLPTPRGSSHQPQRGRLGDTYWRVLGCQVSRRQPEVGRGGWYTAAL